MPGPSGVSAGLALPVLGMPGAPAFAVVGAAELAPAAVRCAESALRTPALPALPEAIDPAPLEFCEFALGAPLPALCADIEDMESPDCASPHATSALRSSKKAGQKARFRDMRDSRTELADSIGVEP